MFGKKELQRELEQKEQQIQELNRRIKEYQDKKRRGSKRPHGREVRREPHNWRSGSKAR